MNKSPQQIREDMRTIYLFVYSKFPKEVQQEMKQEYQALKEAEGSLPLFKAAAPIFFKAKELGIKVPSTDHKGNIIEK